MFEMLDEGEKNTPFREMLFYDLDKNYNWNNTEIETEERNNIYMNHKDYDYIESELLPLDNDNEIYNLNMDKYSQRRLNNKKNKIKKKNKNRKKKNKTNRLKNYNIRKGDWLCPFCNNLNFAFRTVCNICHIYKSNDEYNKDNHQEIKKESIV